VLEKVEVRRDDNFGLAEAWDRLGRRYSELLADFALSRAPKRS